MHKDKKKAADINYISGFSVRPQGLEPWTH